MVRHVVYPSRDRAVVEAELQQSEQPNPDNFGDKLVKYIPAEVIAFFLPAYALVTKLDEKWLDDFRWLGWLLLVVSALGLVGYLLIQADKTKPPRWYFYALSILAFLAWAIGTSTVGGDLFRLVKPEITGKLIIMAAVFLIPLVDEILTRYLPGEP